MVSKIVKYKFNKGIIFVFECLEYDFLKECNTPNLSDLNPHPALSYGATTTAAVPALLHGFLPICTIDKCWHRDLNWQDPFFLSHRKREGTLLLYVNNGWAFESILHFVDEEFKQKLLKWHDEHEKCPTRFIVSDFIKRVKNIDKYFCYIHAIESHPPFYTPNTINWSDEMRKEYKDELRIKAIEFIDEQLGRIMDEVDYDILIVTSDHALVHDWREVDEKMNPYNVFIAIDK